MINSIILVFIGGAIGAIVRELLMLGTPHLSDNFPLDILVANIAAAFLLGLVTALHTRRVISDDTNLLVGTGVMGGLSTFSSFVYGAVVLMGASTQSAVVATIYVGVSLVIGYGAVTLGMKCGKGRQS
ncbi:CrcB family protein [Chelatococcus asaccharovorans]|uniref:Fluoride-specific ion channel FluC n=1 Tax=Chelatococcus asaccharovorans TaxID=28210 RepID=A0A2V3UBT1_9HYPH|nr:CrcB family protein [Chelatococcus asaccharovorans]MBS7703601.1 CrcB family protein [Chelatococcus asaccharovorans]PXW61945.1 protein CrcB [Chelatococcus asaccharovorans]